MKVLYIYLIAINVITFLAYGIDKLKAKFRAWRIPEKTLLFMGAAGGAVGGLLGMQLFRHKTKHVLFYIVNILALIVWCCAYAYFVFIRQR
ncbi:MAG: DUF1294 domain-containing protein [Ruminococcus sp.]|nr:DUF1294 domain-containing protein [Ruminococcus sp.]